MAAATTADLAPRTWEVETDFESTIGYRAFEVLTILSLIGR
jgi:hypothetical protein